MASNSRFQWIQDLAKREKKPPKSLKCLNCQTEFTGFFCPQCGQKSKTRRLTVLAVVKDFMDALSDSDKGFLRTVIDLSQNPGSMLYDYISGKRQRYLSAGKYSFFLIVLFTVNISLLENHYGFFQKLVQKVDGVASSITHDEVQKTDENPTRDTSKPAMGIIKSSDSETVELKFNWFGTEVNKEVTYKRALLFLKYLIPQYNRALFDYLKFFIILWIPIFAFFSFFFFFRSSFNFAEHITINAYLYSHVLLIMTMFSPLYWVLPDLAGTTLLTSCLAAGFFLVYSYLDIFKGRNYLIVKTMSSFTCAMTTYLLALTILTCIQAIHFAVKNIDML